MDSTKPPQPGQDKARKSIDSKLELSHSEIKTTNHLEPAVVALPISYKVVRKSKSNGKEESKSPFPRVERYISANRNISLNEMTGLIEFDRIPITDHITSILRVECANYYGINITKDTIQTVLGTEAYKKKYHPIAEFIDELKNRKYDVSCFDNFVSCFETSMDKSLLKTYLKRWMLGLFDMYSNRWITKNVLVLSGKQDSGKTALTKSILPKVLREYGKVTSFNSFKLTDAKVSLCSQFVACFDEFECILANKGFLADFKNITSSYDISERLPYDRFKTQMYRSAIIMATTNSDQILTDPTGNNRFLAIDMQGFDFKKAETINMFDVWRVIYEYYSNGETSSLTAHEKLLQADENLKYEVEDFTLSLIRERFVPSSTSAATASEVLLYLETLTKQRMTLQRVGISLKKLGFEQSSVRDGKGVSKKYKIQLGDGSENIGVQTTISELLNGINNTIAGIDTLPGL